ncbi:anti-anti-sigma factor [Allocatelliglobosispora scoriae]|uniref:Anti-anti-sigma factor n=1 Tax=Allocatelliglobosispora scoriae TaxID=643052 RepID=A0A841BKW7_9ACTN|nr:STAS domain-containing protein [Allocatelliglobosispora scoriae]MBB5867450.1 anti-anti-sigma factor [Allocatelliglobosispora scoriae]
MKIELATFASSVVDGRCVVSIAGELDISGASNAFVCLMAAVDGGHAAVCVDCAELSFLDMAGLASLTAAARRAEAVKVPFALVNVQSIVRLVIDATGTAYLLGVGGAVGRH